MKVYRIFEFNDYDKYIKCILKEDAEFLYNNAINCFWYVDDNNDAIINAIRERKNYFLIRYVNTVRNDQE